ncbi:hypothetical protein, partial [Streptomyces sp. NPDC013433]|uniref:hypothetical protein n=1 Tax=Streptomyces sp. NPDC013433 TaxID=3155604 RepID=UPI0034526286
MVNEIELLNIINDMNGANTIYNEMDGTYSSKGSPSWNAYQKARSLTDTSYISFLSDLLEKSKKESIKRNIYFMLGKIGENTGDKRVVEILLHHSAGKPAQPQEFPETGQSDGLAPRHV